MRKSDAETKRPRLPSPAVAALGAAALLVLWSAAARAIDSEIVLPSPLRVARAVAVLYPTRLFREALYATFLRGMLAFGLSMLMGTAVGLASGLSRTFRTAISPALTVIRATPVLAVILLAYFWFSPETVPVFAAVLMAFPVVVGDIRQGVVSADSGLLEMARLFRLRGRDRIWSIYVPAVIPHLLSAAHGALGLSWKVVVAGEVLSQPARALGTGMQGARAIWETADVFAWVLAGILLCALSDAVFKVSRKKENDAVRPA